MRTKLKRAVVEALYTFFQYLYRLLFAVVFRWEVYGLENVPASGGAILAVNHASALDPPLGGVALKRKIWYVGRSSLVRNRITNFLLSVQHLVPITRGEADIRAIRRIIKLIRDGEIVLMFPEGTRSPDGMLQAGKEGVGMFVSHARADVIPCYISGAWRALPKGAIVPRPRKVRVSYGPLIKYQEFSGIPGNREGYREISEKIMERIAALKKVLGDHTKGVDRERSISG